MTTELLEKSVYCPYCGETIGLLIDLSVPEQQYIEDCSVCCRPIEVQVSVVGDYADVQVYSEND